MFRLLLLLLLTYQLVVQVAYALTTSAHEEAPTSCVDGCSKRTLSNIIWGCVSTTIICAWAAIHPNMPPREGTFKGALRRLELMFYTIGAPEVLPAWALNQLLAAITVRDVYNEAKGYESCGFWKAVWLWLSGEWFSLSEITKAASAKWTLKHGHFLVMGGIHLVEENPRTEHLEAASDPPVDGTSAEEKGLPEAVAPGRVTILNLEMLRELIKDQEFKIRITDDEITDKSKGDGLSKIIFILQSSWFIMQCVARRVQGLALTQLELTTLALASLNGITLLLWWDKPLGAQTPVRVYLSRGLTDAERALEGRRQSSRSERFDRAVNRLTAIRNFIRRHKALRKFLAVLLSSAIVLLLIFWTIVQLFFGTVQELTIGSSSFLADATHVPTFYYPEHRYSEYLHLLLLISLGSIFGAIHCVGWNFLFPTHAERELWRVASLAITIIPIGPLPLVFMFYSFFKHRSRILNPIRVAMVISYQYFIPLYVCARLVLLGQAIALLWHQPPGAFIAVNWTKFYPHFF